MYIPYCADMKGGRRKDYRTLGDMNKKCNLLPNGPSRMVLIDYSGITVIVSHQYRSRESTGVIFRGTAKYTASQIFLKIIVCVENCAYN